MLRVLAGFNGKRNSEFRVLFAESATERAQANRMKQPPKKMKTQDAIKHEVK